jgi:O-antigen/teichoic acid export membrane protein
MSFKTGLLTYAIADISTRFLALFLYPMYSFFLIRSELGILDLYITISQLSMSFISLQIGDAVYRWLMDRDFSKHHDKVIFCGLATFIATGTTFATAYLILYSCFKWECSAILLAYLLGTACTPMLLQVTRGLQRRLLFVFAALINSVIMFVLCYIFLAYTNLSYKAPLVAGVISHSTTVFVLVLTLRLYRVVSVRNWDWPLIRTMLKYSAPLVSNIAAWWIIGPVNAILITSFLGADTNGLYAMAARLSVILVVINSVFSFAWQDLVIRTEERESGFYQRSFLKYLNFDLSLCVLLAAFSRPLITIATDKSYEEAWRYAPLLILAASLSGLCSFLGAGYLQRRLTLQAFTSNLWGSLINILVTLLTIRLIGAYGAAIGNSLGFAVVFVNRYYSNRELFALTRFPLREFTQYLVALACVVGVIAVLDSMVLQLAFSSVVLIGFIIVNRNLFAELIARPSTVTIQLAE